MKAYVLIIIACLVVSLPANAQQSKPSRFADEAHFFALHCQQNNWATDQCQYFIEQFGSEIAKQSTKQAFVQTKDRVEEKARTCARDDTDCAGDAAEKTGEVIKKGEKKTESLWRRFLKGYRGGNE